MTFNFQRNDDPDSSLRPMLVIFKMDITQVTSDKYVDLKNRKQTILNHVLYYKYETNEIEEFC